MSIELRPETIQTNAGSYETKPKIAVAGTEHTKPTIKSQELTKTNEKNLPRREKTISQALFADVKKIRVNRTASSFGCTFNR